MSAVAVASSRPSAWRLAAALVAAAFVHLALWALVPWTPPGPAAGSGNDGASLHLLLGSGAAGASGAPGSLPAAAGDDTEPAALAGLPGARSTAPAPAPATSLAPAPAPVSAPPVSAAPPSSAAVSRPTLPEPSSRPERLQRPPPPGRTTPPAPNEPPPGRAAVTAVAALGDPEPGRGASGSADAPARPDGTGDAAGDGGDAGGPATGRNAGDEPLGSGGGAGSGTGSGAGPPSPAVDAYFDRLYRQARRSLQRHYPRRARRAGEEGDLVLRVRIDRDGRVVSCRVVEASGSAALDAAAVRGFERAGPFGAVPGEAADGDLEFEYPVEYRLRPGG